MNWMRLARVIGVLTVVIGVVHIGFAEMEYEGFSFDALWFVGSGISVILIGTLTCLAILLGLCFSSMSEWHQPQGPTLVALFTLGAVSSAMLQRRPVAGP